MSSHVETVTALQPETDKTCRTEIICFVVVIFPASITVIRMTSSNGNIFSITGPLWGESTGHRIFYVFYVRPNKRLNIQWNCRWFGTPWCLCGVTVIITSLSLSLSLSLCQWNNSEGQHHTVSNHNKEYRQVSNIRRAKSQQILVLPCDFLCRTPWSQVSSREWRCSCSSADRRCSNYIWVIDNFIAY